MTPSPICAAPHPYLSWTLSDTVDVLGFVSPEVRDILIDARLMVPTNEHLSLVSGDLADTLDAVKVVLAEHGLIETERGETMPVMVAPGLAPIAGIDRSAMRILGLWAIKAHINGICIDRDGRPEAVWLARRSRRSRAAPGAFDTLVAGGVPVGDDPYRTAVREAWEEAGLNAQACRALSAAGAIRAQYVTEQGYHREHLVIYDLVLAADFQPQCMDGEIESFDRLTVSDLADAVASPATIKTSSRLVCDALLDRTLRPG